MNGRCVMKRNVVLTIALFVSSLVSTGYCQNLCPEAPADAVKIVNRNTYYEVILDFQKQPSHRKMGEIYGKKILETVPNFESLIDSFIQEKIPSDELFASVFLPRINDIKPQVPQQYQDEIEGMASAFSGGSQNRLGDGKISRDEIYLMNLISDVLRPSQCSAFGVYGPRSATGNTIASRTMDWTTGSRYQMAQIQAAITFKNGKSSFCSIGWLGNMAVITGINDNQVFAGILDAGTGKPYTSVGKRSYPFDIRTALETCSTLEDVGNYLKTPERSYTYSHLIYLCDPRICTVLENNIGSGDNCIRELRTAKSVLNDGIEWGIDNAIGVVNSFMLKGNFDNHTSEPYNTKRFENIKKELLSKGDKVNLDQVKSIASFHQDDIQNLVYGDLYLKFTHQIVIFEANKPHLQVFFHSRSGFQPNVPTFDRVPLHF